MEEIVGLLGGIDLFVNKLWGWIPPPLYLYIMIVVVISSSGGGSGAFTAGVDNGELLDWNNVLKSSVYVCDSLFYWMYFILFYYILMLYEL